MSRIALLVVTLLVPLSLVGCGSSSPAAAGETAAELVPVGTVLDVDEATVADLVFLREEEKMAHDVYVTLGQRWTLPVFANIQESEQRHMDAVLLLLESAKVADPAEGKGVGEFTNPELASLYAAFVAQGSASQLDALLAGATIEDYDLADLARSASAATDPVVLTVYANLAKGSRNHLRSFVRQIGVAGGSYEPQFLDAAAYQAIVSSPMERGP